MESNRGPCPVSTFSTLDARPPLGCLYECLWTEGHEVMRGTRLWGGYVGEIDVRSGDIAQSYKMCTENRIETKTLNEKKKI